MAPNATSQNDMNHETSGPGLVFLNLWFLNPIRVN